MTVRNIAQGGASGDVGMVDVDLAGDVRSSADFFEDSAYDRPEEKAIEKSMHEEIDNVIDTLRPNEARVIRMRYGLNGAKPMSLKEVGEECSLTKERIRQIEKHAIVRLQPPTRARRLEAYVA